MNVKVYARDNEDLVEIEISTIPFHNSNKRKVYWGWMSTGEMLTEAQIVVLQMSDDFIHEDPVLVDFQQGNANPMYLYMVERESEPVKTRWYGAGIDQGDIGPTGVFSAQGVVNGWRVYRSTQKTQFLTTTEFRTL